MTSMTTPFSWCKTTTCRIRSTGTIAALTAGLAAAAVTIAPVAWTAPAESKLTITVHDPHDVDHQATLVCAPTVGGTHAHAAEACAALTKANGNLNKLEGNFQRPKRWEKVRCLSVPPTDVEVTVKGTWNGKPVDFSKNFSGYKATPCNSAAQEELSPVIPVD
ncbi:SSI family serine proteinase inhibitor [Nocardia sp. NPDC060256]|uniref:SSI family serine proteinase inhibitor n=1 Tax=unclassified Nocardia TaxID=2637762 RepID=UPI00364C6B6E